VWLSARFAWVKFNDGKDCRMVKESNLGIKEYLWIKEMANPQHVSFSKWPDVYLPWRRAYLLLCVNVIDGKSCFFFLTSHATKGIGLHNYIVKMGVCDHPNANIKIFKSRLMWLTNHGWNHNGETNYITHDVNFTQDLCIIGLECQGAKGFIGEKRW